MYNYGTATLTDCTISGNSANRRGGGLWAYGTATLTDCTISGNSGTEGGGVYLAGGPFSRMTIGDTIVAGNAATIISPDLFGTVTDDQGFNLIGDGDNASGFTAAGDQVGTAASPIDPLLAPLGDYGGPTQTMALLAGSPAIDKGDNTLVPIDPSTGLPVTTDQRGFTRVVNGTVDIGAFEDQVVLTTPANAQATTAGSVATVGLGSFADSAINAGNSTVVVDFGDGSPTMTLLDVAPGSLGSVNHTFTSNGTFTVSVTVTDQFSDANLGTLAVVVSTPTAISVSASSATPAFGQPETLTATVTTPSGEPIPTSSDGMVTFFDGTTALGSATLSGSPATATLTTTALAIGSHTITASYSGDVNFTHSSSVPISLTVERDGTTATVVSSANPSVFGQSVTFTVTVSPAAPGGGTATGTVNFMDGSTVLGSPTLSGGVATLITTSLSISNHKIKVVYGGDGNFTGSVSSVLTETVTKDATTTSVTSSANPSVFGQSVTFTATVSAGAPGSGTPTGTVTFNDGSTTLGKSTLSSGSASFSTANLAVASHSITVSYSGDAKFTTSASTALSQVVNQAGTTTSLVSATDPSVFGQAVTFTATVSAAAPGSGTPGGNVTFYDGSISLGTASLSSGSASFTSKALPTGADAITAVYNGGPHFTTSTSAELTQPVNHAGTTSVVTSATNPSVFGQSVTFTATVTAHAPGAERQRARSRSWMARTFWAQPRSAAARRRSRRLDWLSLSTRSPSATAATATSLPAPPRRWPRPSTGLPPRAK